ncbi:MAG: 30S ribosomal protein S4e [Halobacteriales archaeon]
MTHQKRLSAPDTWPVERKTETFTVSIDGGPHGHAGVPLVIVLRDVLGYVENAREAKYAVRSGQLSVNGRPVSDHELPVGLFDILAFEEREEYYRVFPGSGGRLALTPIDADAARTKLSKVVDKQQVDGGRTQLSLHDGGVVLVDEPDAYGTNDSVIVDLDGGDIVHHLPYEEGAMVTAVAGQHAGHIGTIDRIEVHPGSSPNTVAIAADDRSFETVEAYVVVIDEQFAGGGDDE